VRLLRLRLPGKQNALDRQEEGGSWAVGG
jgi:hypothetical protein